VTACTASADRNNPNGAQPVTSRLTAAEIYAAAVQIGEDELKRSSTGLALSDLAAGLGMGLTALDSAAILVLDRRRHMRNMLRMWGVVFSANVVGAAGLAYCIAGSTEALSAVFAGQVSVITFVVWLLAATAGNTVGGVIIVSLLNYGQVVASGRDLQQVKRPLADIEADNATGTSAAARMREHRRRYRWRRDDTVR
jgi:formate/nitrite transporter FocA (FNT family)